MPKLKMEMGAEPNKVAILVGLVAVAAYMFFINSDSTPPSGSSGKPSTPKAATGFSRALNRGVAEAEAAAGPRPNASTARGTRKDFRPSLAPKKGEERDPARIDPTLRLDLLAKVVAWAADPIDLGG